MGGTRNAFLEVEKDLLTHCFAFHSQLKFIRCMANTEHWKDVVREVFIYIHCQNKVDLQNHLCHDS